MDRQLDLAAHGPFWLKDPRLAQLVVNSLRFGEVELHLVLYPEASLARISKAIKGYSGHQANRILGRAGERFWQHESYDHWARNGHELERIVRYTEANPVKAGLVARVEDWPWSSAASQE